MRMLDEDADSNDVAVSASDQEAINAFSRFNSRISEAEDELKAKKEEKEATDEVVMELELVDEEEQVPYKMGDSFIHILQPQALEFLERDSKRLDTDIEELKKTVDECEEGMEKLKVVLYGKFGNNINLERGD
ncbi:Prefoldin, subunit 4 [Jaminaea rosea]|uniref:Prefoldin subunit 4 n=1 Tax=Jaminaea rosea TaxID=1569628 RepID=A0A316V0I1_9BASI|nr:Prefoldin, subunit 4 [Jaminaea rosea]PWN30744.1 Prefoldin, subunit 4 [Jaminaea rosea]